MKLKNAYIYISFSKTIKENNSTQSENANQYARFNFKETISVYGCYQKITLKALTSKTVVFKSSSFV